MKYINYLTITLISLIIFLSCEEAEDALEEFDCTAPSTELITSLASFNNNPSDSASCASLKIKAADFISNGCDTTGVGDLSFIVDSLNCGMLPLSMDEIVGSWMGSRRGRYENGDCTGTITWEQDRCEDDETGDDLPYTDEESCEAAGGNWESPNEGILEFFANMTLGETDCDCPDDYEGSDCDWEEAEGFRYDSLGCIGIGAEFETEIYGTYEIFSGYVLFTAIDDDGPPELIMNIEGDMMDFNFIDYGRCECYDADDNYIEGCDWDQADEVNDEIECNNLGYYWQPGECGIIEWQKMEP